MITRTVPLKQIFKDFPFYFSPEELPDLSITGITLDSRTVKHGNLFVAMQGASMDGHEFIPKAIEGGAAAIVGEKEIEHISVPYIKIKKPSPGLNLVIRRLLRLAGQEINCNWCHRDGWKDNYNQSHLSDPCYCRD